LTETKKGAAEATPIQFKFNSQPKMNAIKDLHHFQVKTKININYLQKK